MKARLAGPLPALPPAPILTVAELGSFSAAGQRLGVSQQVREVEVAHGIRLLDRAEGVLRPTTVCQELAEIGQRIEGAEQDAARVPGRRYPQGKPRLQPGPGNSMPGIAIAARMLSLNPGLPISVATGSHPDVLTAVLRRDVEVAVLPDLRHHTRFQRAGHRRRRCWTRPSAAQALPPTAPDRRHPRRGQ